MMSRIEVNPVTRFLKDLKKLAKKYRHVQSDVAQLIERLRDGETPGDQVTGVRYTVYKVRINATDIQRGKSGGYRAIYYIYTPTRIYLLTIYIKSEQTDISAEQIRQIIEDLGDLNID